jgi:hypothetical protein
MSRSKFFYLLPIFVQFLVKKNLRKYLFLPYAASLKANFYQFSGHCGSICGLTIAFLSRLKFYNLGQT